MTYEGELGGRVEDGPSGCGRDYHWTFDDVQERLIEAIELWRRSPANGLGPSVGNGYATDAPWQLMTKAVRASAGDLALMEMWRLEQDEARRSSQPQTIMGLSRDEVERRDETSEWLRFVGERDRKMLVMALVSLAAGAKSVPWLSLWKSIGRGKPGPDGLRKRYSQAIQQIAVCLNSRKSA